MTDQLSAERFVERLRALRGPGAPTGSGRSVRVPVRMGDVFALAKEFVDLDLDQIDALLDGPVHEVRVGERRTAIVATWYFIRQGQLDDTFAIAELLVDDEHDLVRKAVGGWVREAGKRDPGRLHAFLDAHAATMPRTTLRYAVEHLDAAGRRHYLAAAGGARRRGAA